MTVSDTPAVVIPTPCSQDEPGPCLWSPRRNLGAAHHRDATASSSRNPSRLKNQRPVASRVRACAGVAGRRCRRGKRRAYAGSHDSADAILVCVADPTHRPIRLMIEASSSSSSHFSTRVLPVGQRSGLRCRAYPAFLFHCSQTACSISKAFHAPSSLTAEHKTGLESRHEQVAVYSTYRTELIVSSHQFKTLSAKFTPLEKLCSPLMSAGKTGRLEHDQLSSPRQPERPYQCCASDLVHRPLRSPIYRHSRSHCWLHAGFHLST
jgi:hypothetical protein